ncbi:MAG: hypothetical protein ACOC32_01820 [Nanoarchaeota archaeon]
MEFSYTAYGSLDEDLDTLLSASLDGLLEASGLFHALLSVGDVDDAARMMPSISYLKGRLGRMYFVKALVSKDFDRDYYGHLSTFLAPRITIRTPFVFYMGIARDKEEGAAVLEKRAVDIKVDAATRFYDRILRENERLGGRVNAMKKFEWLKEKHYDDIRRFIEVYRTFTDQ